MRRQTIQRNFSGGIAGTVGAVAQYLGNTTPSAGGTSGAPIRYPITGNRTARRIDVYVITNTFTGATTLKVLKDGVNTALTITIPSGVTGLRSFEATVPFSNAGLDIGVTCPSTGLLNRFECSATVSLD